MVSGRMISISPYVTDMESLDVTYINYTHFASLFQSYIFAKNRLKSHLDINNFKNYHSNISGIWTWNLPHFRRNVSCSRDVFKKLFQAHHTQQPYLNSKTTMSSVIDNDDKNKQRVVVPGEKLKAAIDRVYIG